MKSIFFLALWIGFSLHVNAQKARFTIFSENGERFFAYYNGKLMNAGLQSSVTSKDLQAGGIEIRVVFDNPNFAPQNYNILLHDGMEMSLMMKKNKKGEFVLRYKGEMPIVEDNTTEEVVQYTYTTPITTTNQTQNPGNPSPIGKKINETNDGSNTAVETTNGTVTTTVTISKPVAPKIECNAAMPEDAYYNAKASLDAKTWDDAKLIEAKQIINANCLNSYQIKDMLNTFSYEDSKLTIAKFAYKKCTDKSNYYIINDAFTFSSSMTSLNAYINSVK